jgi:hypothetical protein
VTYTRARAKRDDNRLTLLVDLVLDNGAVNLIPPFQQVTVGITAYLGNQNWLGHRVPPMSLA